MRVAHFIQRYPPALGGSEAYFARLSRYLVNAGDQVTVFTTSALDLDAFWSRRGRCLPPGTQVEDGIEVRRYPLVRVPGRRYLLKALSFIPHHTWQCLTLPCNPIAWKMWTDAGRAELAFDLVHASAFPYAWPIACGRRLAKRLRVPFHVTPFLHLGDPANPRDRTRQAYLSPALLSLLRSADRVFVQTQLERAALLERGLDEDKLVLVGMGVAAEECTGGNREEARKTWAIPDDTVAIGHLANQSEEKGSVDLLRAAERLWLSGRSFYLILAGPEMPNFRRFWRDFAAKGCVRRLGVLSDPQKRDFFAGLDMFALPSRSDSFGLVLLEAWSNRLPNVAYRAGGVAEVIRHGEDGLLTPCGDVAALAEALERLIGDRMQRRKLGTAGQHRVGREFCWEDKLERVRRTYLEMVPIKMANQDGQPRAEGWPS